MEKTTWSDALAEAVGIALPVDCLGCGAPNRALCSPCRGSLDEHPGRVRLVAGVRCDAAFEYTGIARDLVLALKVRGRTDVAGPLGRATGRAVRRALAAAPPGTVVMRVPSSVAGRRRRGFDPVVVLLRRGGVHRAAPLRRVRGRPSTPSGSGGQKSLTALERVEATVGTLRAVGVRDRSVVLVDDVVTTGVTMAEAVRAVLAGGGSVVRCVATASVEPIPREPQSLLGPGPDSGLRSPERRS